MAPSSIPDPSPLRAPEGVHLLLSWGLPTAFVMLATFWLTGLTPLRWEVVINGVYALLLFFWGGWRHRTKQGLLLRAWVWTVPGLLAYGAQALVEGLSWPGLFRLDATHTLWFLAGFVQAQLTALWASQLASRARLFQLIVGIPEGIALEDRVRSFQLDADFSQRNQAVLAGSLAVMASISVILASVTAYGHGLLTVALLAAYLLAVTLSGVLLRSYRREMGSLIYGYRLSWNDKLKPLAWSLLLALMAGGGAWLMLGLGGPWFNWQLLDFSRSPDAPPMPLATGPERPALPAYQGSLRAAVLLTLLAKIFCFQNVTSVLSVMVLALTWAWPLALGAFLVWPLVKWVAGGGRETRGLLQRWLRLLGQQVRMFARTFGRWFDRPSPRATPVQSLGPESVREWIRSFLSGSPPGRRAPVAEVIQAFLALVEGARPLVPYLQGQTTREFLKSLAQRLPEASASLEFVATQLDRELFSLEGLSVQDRQRLLSGLEELTQRSAFHEGDGGVR